MLTDLPATTSVGKIWRHGLAALARHATIRVDESGGRLWRRRPSVDVWLCDGHQGPLEVTAPVVAHLHEAAWADPTLRPLMDPAFLERFEATSAAAASRAARIITVSESSKAQITAAYSVPPDRVVVAPNGVDHGTFRPDLPPPTDLLSAAGGDPHRPYVLFVSTVHPRKNLAALRDALAILAREGRPLPLVLVAGRAADRGDSAALVRAAVEPIPGIEVPPVNLAGLTDVDLARLMGGAAAFCLPSLMEGFGMAVAEAMACGTPVVVSDRGSLPEVVGRAGIVTTPDGPSVAVGLREVLGSRERQVELRAAGLRRAAAYTWEAMADQWAGALHAALADERAVSPAP
jgi:glycosyltransferase involved in cell wall biosynthesis